MDAIHRLKRDHTILRTKLDVLESALQMRSDAWFVLREVCFTLARQLRDHIKREETLVRIARNTLIPPPTGGSGTLPPVGGGMNPRILAEVALEHKDEPRHLRTINRLFVSESGHSLEHIRPALAEVIHGLRRHMDEEERELFPILERVLAEGLMIPMAERPTSHLDETMTVNRIVNEFPATRTVFERLFIGVPTEGCDCLDEVAWRHGMESRDLLKRLEEAITCSCSADEALQTTGAPRYVSGEQ